MNAAACPVPPDFLPDQRAPDDNEVRTQVWGLLSTLYPKLDLVERRHEARYPFPYLIHLAPVRDDGVTPCGEGLAVVGKHMSQRGLSFFHPKPLPYRRVIVSIESGTGRWFGFLMDLTWCRFTKEGWYESGGRFLQAVLSPLGRSANHPA